MLCARLAPTNISMTKTSNSSMGGSSKGDKKRKRGTGDALAPSPEPHSLIRKNGVQRRGKKKAATAGDAAQEQLVASASKKVKESHDSEDGAGSSSNATSSKEVDKPETQGAGFRDRRYSTSHETKEGHRPNDTITFPKRKYQAPGQTNPSLLAWLTLGHERLAKECGTDAASAHAPGPVARLGHLEEIDAAARHEWSRLEQVLGLCSMIAEAIGPLDEVVEEEEEKNRSILAKKMDIASLEKLMAAKMRCESLGL
ncbi:hypothetical protein E4U38_000445 [Claviceps purpurea]|nr:hypothetical protein E4U38_000445 [Claviceps purpurea]